MERLPRVVALGFVLGGLLFATAIVMPASSVSVNPSRVGETVGASHLAGSGEASATNPIVGSGPTNAGTAPTNVSYCELLGPHPGTSANLPSYVPNVSALWYKLCVQPEFVTLINSWGAFYPTYFANATANVSYVAAGNLSVEVEGSGTEPPFVYFNIFHTADCNNTRYGPLDTVCDYQQVLERQCLDQSAHRPIPPGKPASPIYWLRAVHRLGCSSTDRVGPPWSFDCRSCNCRGSAERSPQATSPELDRAEPRLTL